MSKLLITVDLHDRECIIIEECEKPSESWISMQKITPSGEGKWYKLYPLSGGSVSANKSDLRNTREATESEFNKAYGNATPTAQKTLNELQWKSSTAHGSVL